MATGDVTYVADRNNASEMADVEKLTHEAADKMQTLAWNDCMYHAENCNTEISKDKFPEIACWN
jgi:hypothetical protein